MNVQNNKRRQETRRRIENVFLDYLKVSDISQVKVSDICKKANINRGTFYSNYLDVYDLAESILKSLQKDVSDLLERNIRWNYNESDFLKLFEHIKNNQELYFAYFKLCSVCRVELDSFIIPSGKTDFGGEYVDYHITFFKSGLDAIIKKWLNGGCKESPSEMQNVLIREYRGRFNEFK